MKDLEEVSEGTGSMRESDTLLEFLHIVIGQRLTILLHVVLSGQISQSVQPACPVSMEVKLHLSKMCTGLT